MIQRSPTLPKLAVLKAVRAYPGCSCNKLAVLSNQTRITTTKTLPELKALRLVDYSLVGTKQKNWHPLYIADMAEVWR